MKIGAAKAYIGRDGKGRWGQRRWYATTDDSKMNTYLHQCDGYRLDGRKCVEERRIEAFNLSDADAQIRCGWLCQHPHWR